MSILEICLMVGMGVGVAVYCTILIVKCVKRKRSVKNKPKKVIDDEEIEETRE